MNWLIKGYIRFSELLRNEEGDALIEYALLIALVSIALVAGASVLVTDINKVWVNIGAQLLNAIGQ